MIRQEEFVRDEILPSWFVNRLQDRIAALSRLRLRRVNVTTIEAVAGANDDAAVLNVGGQWRLIEAPVQRAHPGGAAGTYLIFATAKAQNIVNAPQPNTDLTDYAFALAIVPNGQTPAIVAGAVDAYRRIGRLVWDGAAITSLVQEVGAVGGAQLEDGAVVTAGGLSVTRQADGALLLDFAGDMATQAELDSTQADVAGHETRLDALEAAPEEGTLFLAGWGAPGYLRFYRDAHLWVRFRGNAVNAPAGGGNAFAAGAEIGTMPAGFWPDDPQMFPVFSATGVLAGMVSVDQGGVIRAVQAIPNGSAFTFGSIRYIAQP